MKTHHFLAIAGLFALPVYLYFLYTGRATLDLTWGAFAVLISIFSAGHLLGQAVDVDKLIRRVEKRAKKYGGDAFEERLKEKKPEKTDEKRE